MRCPFTSGRAEIMGRDGKVLAADGPETLRQQPNRTTKAHAVAEQSCWTQAARRWERYHLTTWSFGDVPERVEITTVQGLPVFAYPGLQIDEAGVSLRLFRKSDDAETATMRGFEQLCALAMQELAWLQRDLKAPASSTICMSRSVRRGVERDCTFILKRTSSKRLPGR
jgi:ATP-dependent helicase HrpA